MALSRAYKLAEWTKSLRQGGTVNCKPIPIPSTIPGAKIKPFTSLRRSRDYQIHPKQLQYVPSYNLGIYSPKTFGPSATNEKEALMARVLKTTPVPVDVRIKQLRDFVFDNFDTIFPRMRRIPADSISTYLKNTNASPRVKQTIAAARDELDRNGISEFSGLSPPQIYKFCHVKAFVKVENNLYYSRTELLKAPRIISSMPPQFIALTGPWFAAAQRRLIQAWNPKFPLVFTSGHKGADICDAVFKNPNHTILEDDVSAFDASLGRGMLELERDIFLKMGAPRTVYQLVNGAIDTHGYTHHFKYQRPGGRKSGVPYTSFGNTTLDICMHLFLIAEANEALSRSAFRKFFASGDVVMAGQGDDIIGAYKRLRREIDFVAGMAAFGFKADGLHRRHPTEAEFCSCHVIPFREGYNFVPKLGRVIAKFGHFCDPPMFEHPHALLRGVCLGGLATTGGSPYLRDFYAAMLSLTPRVELTGRYHKFFRSEEWKMRLTDRTPYSATYAFYHRVYHLTQHSFGLIMATLRENYLKTHKPVSDIVQLVLDRDTASSKWIYN